MAEETRGARKVSARQQARLAAAEKAAKFEKLAAERRRLAEEVILGQDELDAFADETERLVAKLKSERAVKLAEKTAAVDAAVVALLETGVDAAEAAERTGLTSAEVKAAKKRHDTAPTAQASPEPAGSATVPHQSEPTEQPAAATQPPGTATV